MNWVLNWESTQKLGLSPLGTVHETVLGHLLSATLWQKKAMIFDTLGVQKPKNRNAKTALLQNHLFACTRQEGLENSVKVQIVL